MTIVDDLPNRTTPPNIRGVLGSPDCRAGYARLTLQRPRSDAVSWWYWRQWPDGFTFARGGRVATAREARKTIRDMGDLGKREYAAWRKRPTRSLS